MASSVLLSDNGASSGSAGIKSTGGNDGVLLLQTTTSGGTATTAVTLDNNQNMGLGVTPSAWRTNDKVMQVGGLVYSGFVGAGYGVFYGNNFYRDSGGFKYIQSSVSAGRFDFDYTSGGAFAWNIAPTGTAGNAITFTQAMTLDASGNLLLGATSSNGTLTIKNTNTAPHLISIQNQSSSGELAYTNFDQATDYWTFKSNQGSGRTYFIQSTAGVYLAAGGTSWTSASDERVKDIIEPIQNATEKLSGWRAVIGKYKTDEDNKRRSFLIAQDVLSTFPEAVDTDNSDEYGVRYQDLIPLLTAAIQEQQAIITQLQADVAALKGAQA